MYSSVSPIPGETRRILSVQPTYDWTCFSHSLLNVSPMPVESSPPLPCPTPCHLLPNCTSCLDSKGADGGWQHCVWSSSLQQVFPLPLCPSVTFLSPLSSFLCPPSCSPPSPPFTFSAVPPSQTPQPVSLHFPFVVSSPHSFHNCSFTSPQLLISAFLSSLCIGNFWF